jgi:hypothetical protein
MGPTKKTSKVTAVLLKKDAFRSVAFSDYRFIHRVASEMSKYKRFLSHRIFGRLDQADKICDFSSQIEPYMTKVTIAETTPTSYRTPTAFRT